jgi:cell wall-associated NlpC family hydrolase
VVGWVEQSNAPTLGAALTPEAARAQQDAQPRVWMLGDFEQLRAGSSFALLSRDEDSLTIAVPGIDGPVERELPQDAPVHAQALPFSRRAVFTQAFALLEQPYGWGGRDGHRDCSSYLLDVFAQFDVRLPRNSAVQAQLGTQSVDLSQQDEASKTAAIRTAARAGVVLLYMPGHIMLYLGHDGAHDYGISALSEFLTPCPGGPDVVHRLDKVAVTTLEVGRGTERRAFIERITRMAVFGPLP